MIEKKYIADILKTGSFEIPRRRDDQSDESYVMMRKFGLILLRDIIEERDSLVHREFADFLTVEDEVAIREKFKESPTLPDDDINTSVAQTKKLIIAIKQGLTYPPCNGGFVYADVIEFFNKLSDIFDWPIYEKSTLGSESKRKWYAVILCQWMEGSGLSYIMKRAIEYHKNHPDNFRVSAYQPPTTYNDRSKEHRNVVFADTLEVIENVILFSISNYFLRFSNEYKKVRDVTEFDNNWYEYVEFGTTNPLTILLQRNDFSRESATYIRNHKDEYVVHDGSGGELKLKSSLLTCGNTSVMTEAASIKFNFPGLFIDDSSESGLCCVANYDSARVELYFGKAKKEDNKKAFDTVILHKAAIENSLGVKLNWNRGDDIKSSKISYQINDVSIENETDWLQMAKFHAQWSKKFYDIIVPYFH